MNFLLEICLAACIIYLLNLNNLLKNKLNNADSLDKENNLLKSQLTNREKEFNLRESTLNKTIEKIIDIKKKPIKNDIESNIQNKLEDWVEQRR